MDINGVTQSIESTNNLVASAITTQTELANKVTNLSVKENIQGGAEEGKGNLLDLIA